MKTITALVARGSHFDVGQQLGQQARHAFSEILPKVERFRALEREWRGSDRVAALEQAARTRFPDYMSELEGIAAGAEADFARVFLWNCRGDLPGGGDQSQSTSLGCTSLMVPPRPGQHGLIGHNEDDQLELDGHCCFVDVHFDDGGGFHSFYSPGLLPGHTFAVNHRGLVQTINHIRPLDQRVGVPRHFNSRAVLDCATLDDAVSCLRDVERASGFHHNLGMAGDQRLLSVEAPASGFALREASTPMIHTNHLLDNQFADTPQTIAPSSGARQERGEQLLATAVSPAVMPFDILGDVANEDLPIYRKGQGYQDPGYTLATAVFQIHKGFVNYQVFARQDQAPEHVGTVEVA